MPKPAVDILLTFPPRMLSSTEQMLVQEWIGLANDVPFTYVSQRRSDDPALFGRVVIATGPDAKTSHTIHAPAESAPWLLTSMGPPRSVQQFNTLHDALNSVRPVLA